MSRGIFVLNGLVVDEQTHNIYMQRALELARQAVGHTSPNPAVGAVIVKNGEVIAEGFTQPPGKPHAEAGAIALAGDRARGATIYVTLEPCNHFGRTPPCTLGIIESGIAEVHYAIPDPNPQAAGGHQRLLDAGVRVFTGRYENEAREINRAFFYHTKTGLPYVTAKFATSLDGKIATRTGESQWITGPAARQMGHELRHQSDGILVGAATATADNPSLTTRLPESDARTPSHPIRIVLDSQGRLNSDLNLLNGSLSGRTIIAVTDQISSENKSRLQQADVDLLEVASTADGRIDVSHLLELLGKQNIQSVMVEGGSQVLGSFFSQGLINEVWAFIAPKVIGGQTAPGPIGGQGFGRLQDALTLKEMRFEQVGEDILIRGEVK